MAGKKQAFKRTRKGTPRSGWKQGPASWRRLFLYEMARTNNPLTAIKHARITWSCYQEWLESGFLSQTMLDDAYRRFKSKHPTTDIIASKHTDEQLEDSGLGVAATAAVEATGYDERTVLNDDGWVASDDWEW
jgi:hypothetical protein